jgi:hypothetical protein
MSYIYVHDLTQDKIVSIFTNAATVLELKQEIKESLGLTDEQTSAAKIVYGNRELKEHYDCVRYTWACMRPPANLTVTY